MQTTELQTTGLTTPPRRTHTVWEWIWKSAISGFCGSAASTALMYFKAKAGILPSFQPYENFQMAAGHLFGHDIHPGILWLVSFFNGSTVIGLVFGYLYRYLPGGSGTSKGLVFGICGWLVMNLLAFPMIGLGSFATSTGLGFWPAMFSLAMLTTYSLAMGSVYGVLERSEGARR
ncbi:DUF6789 family protein [Bradyrhizobium sp. Bra78]|uniref:DUF6789 family protein n=1 Tax=Bradyrhizobium sp. Bra78 TaxID=2926010 RepID=UPI002905B03E|nr:DUF6789 family protein [Bradyrhizobium sp. Bra78]